MNYRYYAFLILPLWLLISLSPLVCAQNAARGVHEHTHIGYVPREVMSRPISLRAGIGAFHEEITTRFREAQKFYDQGQAYLHSYMWIEAARSFHQALRFDPRLAMAFVGLSYAYSPIDYTAARQALDRADALNGKISVREKRRIQIRRLQLEAMLEPQNSEKLQAVRVAMDQALAAEPNDAEMLLLRGNAEENTPFADGQGCVTSAIPYYQKAIKIEQNNFAAEHYLTHCYENAGLKAEEIGRASCRERV